MKKLSVVFLACLMGVSLAVASGNQNAPRVIRVTMNDGTIHEFLVESVQNMTFDANQEDSSFVLPDTREPEPNLTEEYDNPYVKARPSLPKNDRKVVAPVMVKKEQPVQVTFDVDKQALEFFSAQGGDARFIMMDAIGSTVVKGDVYLSKGSTVFPVRNKNLNRGSYVVKLVFGGKTIQQNLTINAK
ncbi:MAG: hypothetical protein IKJ76_00745 [Fibrobacter sp.]|nr:hypothetical protein [Fibrobacter sp.]